jgi:hypothetical protein
VKGASRDFAVSRPNCATPRCARRHGAGEHALLFFRLNRDANSPALAEVANMKSEKRANEPSFQPAEDLATADKPIHPN